MTRRVRRSRPGRSVWSTVSVSGIIGCLVVVGVIVAGARAEGQSPSRTIQWIIGEPAPASSTGESKSELRIGAVRNPLREASNDVAALLEHCSEPADVRIRLGGERAPLHDAAQDRIRLTAFTQPAQPPRQIQPLPSRTSFGLARPVDASGESSRAAGQEPRYLEPWQLQSPGTSPRRIDKTSHLAPTDSNRLEPVNSLRTPLLASDGESNSTFGGGFPQLPANKLRSPAFAGNALPEVPTAPSVGEVQLIAGQGMVLRTAARVGEVTIADPGVCDAQLFGGEDVLLLGKTAGTTTVTFWTGEEQPLGVNYLVRVQPDPAASSIEALARGADSLQSTLRRMFPENAIRIRPVSRCWVIDGMVTNRQQAERIMAVVHAHTSTSPPRTTTTAVDRSHTAAQTAFEQTADPNSADTPRGEVRVVDNLRLTTDRLE